MRMMMALNAETNNDDGSERRTENANGFERWNWEEVVALNAETEKRWWLWMPNWKC